MSATETRPPREAPANLPRLGPRGWARWTWRQLTSMRTALFLLLLLAVAAVPGIARVRYTSPHPKDMKADVVAAMAECPEVVEHLHLPAQSGRRLWTG